MKRKFTYLLLFLMLFAVFQLQAQDRLTNITNQLNSMAVDMPGLEEKVELSVNGASIEEFIRGIAITNKLNISVDPNLETKIVNNFSNVTVTDVLVFLAKEHNLDISFTGNIISIGKFIPPPTPVAEKPPPQPGAIMDGKNDRITLDYNNVPLSTVVREITMNSDKNVLLTAGLENQMINGFIKEMPFESALKKLALTNGLKAEKTDDNYYLIYSDTVALNEEEESQTRSKLRHSGAGNAQEVGVFEYEANSELDISIYANDVAISDIVKAVSDELQIGYYVNSALSGNASLFVSNVTYEDLLGHLFNASEYTFQKVDNIYLIGERKIESLRSTAVVQLQHRSLEHVVENIPVSMTDGVDIKEFSDLNSLILSGSKPNIAEITAFIKQIDKVVPVVLIEVLLIDYSTDRTVSAGVRVGVAQTPAEQSSGSLYPELKYDFNSQSVNNLIENFNGNGFLNLGKVTPNFYTSINALEEQGILRVRSTPKLATLNGTEASLSIGNTEYYIVESNNVIGTQNPQNIITRQYQSVNADLSVTIKPFVSGDDQITLEIQVEQSDFTARVSPDAPPGSVTRSFSSLLRVKNEEMVLLGGLEQKATRDSGSGVPLLSRIPVIKWLFSNRSRSKSKSKLNIFIKPTVLY